MTSTAPEQESMSNNANSNGPASSENTKSSGKQTVVEKTKAKKDSERVFHIESRWTSDQKFASKPNHDQDFEAWETGLDHEYGEYLNNIYTQILTLKPDGTASLSGTPISKEDVTYTYKHEEGSTICCLPEECLETIEVIVRESDEEGGKWKQKLWFKLRGSEGGKSGEGMVTSPTGLKIGEKYGCNGWCYLKAKLKS